MSKKFFITGLLLTVISACCIACYQKVKTRNFDNLTLANIEALSSDEKATPSEQLDCSYERDEIICATDISSEIKVKLLGFKIINGTVDGTITVIGNECRSGGTSTCAPLRCDRYWEIMFGKN